jgi:hypothetical protein
VNIPDFCLACGRRYAPLPPTVAARYAKDVARERNMRSRYVVLGVLWWAAVVAVAAGLVAAAAWAVG